jgi:TRAP-type C4-dicarboxylate transport system substrate-binding protein
MDGALGGFLAQKIEERVGYRILGWFENGFRHISNRLRPVHAPADLAGMRIRVLPSEVHRRTFELIGAAPMRMDLTEAIAMIKAGTLDAQENPFANTVTYGVHKFHQFHTLTSHFYVSRPVFINRAARMRIVAEQERQVDEAKLGHAVGEIARRLITERELAAFDQSEDVLGLVAVIHDVEHVVDRDAIAETRLEPVADECEGLAEAGRRRPVTGHADLDRLGHASPELPRLYSGGARTGQARSAC